MADNFKQAISKTIENFNNLCSSVLTDLTGYNFMSIEGYSTDEHKKLLDIHAGIDIWAYTEKGVRGLASRIQTSEKSWDTFTVRKTRDSGAKTEYEKRKTAIEESYLYPYYTMQAYVYENSLVSLAVCKTKELFNLISEGKCTERHTGKEQQGQASFYVVKWDSFNSADIRKHYPKK